MSMRLRRSRAYLPLRHGLAAVHTLARNGRCRAVRRTTVCFRLILFALTAASFGLTGASANQFVELDYNISLNSHSRGSAFIELFDDRPLTRDNFLAYVNGGRYNSTLMHRLAFSGATPFVLQGGGYYLQYQTEPPPLNVSLNPNLNVDLDGNSGTANPTVNNEFGNTPFRSNLKGTLAMAKLAGNANSATSEFFFNLSDNAGTSPNGLDFQNGGFTVFARVVGDGMNLIDAYTGLTQLSLDQDADHNGVRDAGPFSEVPALVNGSNFLPLFLDRAKVVDYLGNGLTTTIPAGGLTFSTRDAFIDTGTVFTGTDSLGIGPGRTLGIREGYSLGQKLVNHGTLAPGLQLGSITVPRYEQYSDGTLNVQLRNTTVDTEYDRVAVTGPAFLAGKLSVSTLSGFSPNVNNSFTILTAASITGAFTSFDLPTLNAGLVWNISKTSTAYTLSVVAADYNHNGIVDMADYVMWRNATPNASVTPYSGVDGSGNGVIDAADYLVWRNNFGNVQGTAGAASGSLSAAGVPEPASAVLVLCSGLMFAAQRGRRMGGTP